MQTVGAHAWPLRAARLIGRCSISALVGVACVAVFCLIPALRIPDEFLYGLHFPMSAKPGGKIVIVAIDDQTVARYGPPPWNRALWARLVERLSQAKARIIAIDMFFDTELAPDGDRAFERAAQQAGSVILATGHDPAEPWQPLLTPYPQLAASVLAVGHAGLVRADMNPQLGVTSVSVADYNSESGVRYPSFVPEVASRYLQGARPPDLAEPSFPTTHKLSIAPVSIDCCGRTDQFAICYVGDQRSFPTISFDEALDEKTKLTVVEGSLVIVGVTFASSGDTFRTPMSLRGHEELPGVVVLANALHTAVSGHVIRPLFAFHHGILAALLFAVGRGARSWRKAIIAAVSLAIGLAVASWLLLAIWCLQVNVLPLFLGGAFGIAVGACVCFRIAPRE